jgi:hypothetical protein
MPEAYFTVSKREINYNNFFEPKQASREDA